MGKNAKLQGNDGNLPEEVTPKTRKISALNEVESNNEQDGRAQGESLVGQSEAKSRKAREDRKRRERNTSIAATTVGMLVLGIVILNIVIIKWVGEESGGKAPGNISLPSQSQTATIGSENAEENSGRETKSRPEENEPAREKPRTQKVNDYPVPKKDLFQKTDLSFLDGEYYAAETDEENAAIAQSIQNTIDAIPIGSDLDLAQIASDYALGSKKQALIMIVSGQNGWHVNNLQSYTKNENEPRKVAFTIDNENDTPMFFVAGLYDPAQDLFELDTYSATQEGAKSGAITSME